MSLLEHINQEMKSALKSGDSARLSTLRLIKAAAKNKEIELRRPLADEDLIAVLSSMVKKHNEAIELYEKAGNAVFKAKEEHERGIIQTFLPQPLTEFELVGLIAKGIESEGAQGPQDLGRVMKALKGATAGRVDGRLLADKVKELLSKKS